MKRNSRLKRFTALLMCIAVLCMFPLSVSAIDGVDTSKMCDLTLSYSDSGTGIEGVNVKIYKVADMNAASDFNLTDAFKDSALKLNEYNTSAEWETAATTLTGYAAKSTPAAIGTSSAEGTLSKELPVGLYLIVSDSLLKGTITYSFKTSLLSLPNHPTDNAEIWDYNVTVSPKMSKVSEGGIPEPPGGGSTYKYFKLIKHWSGDEGEESDRPASVTVDIMKNTAVFKTVTLSDDNNWTYSWNVKNPDTSAWSVVETNVPTGYIAAVDVTSNNGTSAYPLTYTITNEKTTDLPDLPPGLSDTPTSPGITIPDDPTPGSGIDIPEDEPGETIDIPNEDVPLASLPQTGQLWWPIPFLAIAGLMLFTIGWRLTQNDKRKYEKA